MGGGGWKEEGRKEEGRKKDGGEMGGGMNECLCVLGKGKTKKKKRKERKKRKGKEDIAVQTGGIGGSRGVLLVLSVQAHFRLQPGREGVERHDGRYA